MKKYLLSIVLCLGWLLSFSQQYPDRHSTSRTDAWLSCSTSQSPNSVRGNSHWVHYDLGSSYVLDQIILWNYNDPSNLENGVNEIAIDFSNDGINWSEVATTTVPISDGSAFYEGEEIYSLGGISANHILITIISNHGGSCSGFSELKISSAAILPVSLSKFEAECVEANDGVIIAWRSENEIGNDFYTIQRSTNAVDWIDVVDVPAKGVNGLGADYYEIDKNIIGPHFYRLVNTDLDGQRQTFDIVVINCNQGPMTMSVINPFTNELTFTYISDGEGIVQFIVESIDGRLVYEGYSKDAGEQMITIPSSDWINGTYIITVLQNGDHVKKKLVKM